MVVVRVGVRVGGHGESNGTGLEGPKGRGRGGN